MTYSTHDTHILKIENSENNARTKVKGIGNGEGVIVAHAYGFTARLRVQVAIRQPDPVATGISITSAPPILSIGTKYRLATKINYANDTEASSNRRPQLTWHSSNDKVLRVKNRVVEPLSLGNATVTVSIANSNISTNINMRVEGATPTALQLEKTVYNIPLHASYTRL